VTRPALALVPLDERPVCTGLPVAIAGVAGVGVLLPPAHCLPTWCRGGDADGLGAWLRATSPTAVAAVVSLEGLGLGGLIPSRLGHESVLDVRRRWEPLDELGIPVHASIAVPRAPNSQDTDEEPAYWADHGPGLHRLSLALVDGVHLDSARAVVPPQVRTDWLVRRLRQYQLALSAIELTARGTLASLLIGIDDAVPGSLSCADASSLDTWAQRLELGRRVLVQPGADEAGAVLVSRALLALSGGTAPRVSVACADPEHLRRVAPYEVAPVGETAAGQLRAAGAVVVDDSSTADAVLVVHPPDGSGDWALCPPFSTDRRAAVRTADLVASQFRAAGGTARPVAVADVAQPNGADPELVHALSRDGVLGSVSAYAGWNTAGNTLGTAAAHLLAVVAGHRLGTYDAEAHRALLTRRLVEDWAWMSVQRPALRRRLGLDPRRHDRGTVGADELPAVEAGLNQNLAALPETRQWRVARGSAVLPWNRTFEIDLRIDRVT
jgi:hypothetical protein